VKRLLTASTTGLAIRKRGDFTSRFIETGTSISDDTTPMADIDWDAAITALTSGDLPCSGGERRILQLSASLAGGIPVDLQDAVTGLDDTNIALLLTAITHASGSKPKVPRRQEPPGITCPRCGAGIPVGRT
jgi:hypothetical protein